MLASVSFANKAGSGGLYRYAYRHTMYHGTGRYGTWSRLRTAVPAAQAEVCKSRSSGHGPRCKEERETGGQASSIMRYLGQK